MKVEDGKVIEPCRGCHTDEPDLEEDCFLNCIKGCFKDSGVRTYGIDASRFLKPINEEDVPDTEYYRDLIKSRKNFLEKLRNEMERFKRFIDEKVNKDNKEN